MRTILIDLLRDVRENFGERPVDVVVFSGDLAFSGLADELAIAATHLLDPIQEALSLRREQIVIVPGNHDVDRRLIDPDLEAGYEVNLSSRDELSEFLANSARLGRATDRLRAWFEFREKYYAGATVTEIPPLGFLHSVQSHDGVRIQAAALNTAWRSSGDADHGRLLLGSHQLQAALRLLSDAELPLLVFHHPPEWLAHWDGDEVRRLAAAGKVLLLTGHDHVADPTFEATVRGTVLHSRGACLYGSFDFRNGYTVIDVNVPLRKTDVRLRSWFHDRQQFDAAVDVVKGGELLLDWPATSSEIALRTDIDFSDVMSGLADLVQQRSIISDYLAENGGVDRQVDDVLVAPRLWPVPYRDAVAMAARESVKVERLDNRSLVVNQEVVIVAGEAESGVTGSLLWLLANRYAMAEVQLPVYVPFDSRFKDTRFERWLTAEVGRYGVAVRRGESIPPLIIAIDDVKPAHTGALKAFARYVKEHPQHSFILGSHGDAIEELERELREQCIAVRVAHTGPFGRRELRSFVEKITGSPSDELVNRVTQILRTERLPRNPFIITALVTVIVKNIELADVNESSLLDAYVSFLLGQGETYDRSGLDLDHRRREHLLEVFAVELMDRDALSVSRQAFEEFVLRFFRERDWGERLSAGRVADDLIGRRVLFESRDGQVGFRHPAFRALFAGKAMLDNKPFAERLLNKPLVHEAPIRHAAGLKRNDADLLKSFARQTRSVMADAAAGFDVEMFDWIKLKPGWSHEHPDVEELIERLDVPLPEPAAEEDIDDQVDEYQDRLDFVEPEVIERHPVDVAASVALALSRVLRSSELVDDVQLKTDVLKAVLGDWGTFAVMAAVREDQDGDVRKAITEGLPKMTGQVPDQEAIARVVDLLIVFVTTFVVQATLSTVHLEGTVRRVMDDKEFMSSTVHALLATALYAGIGAEDWPDRLGNLYRAHSEHPVVAEIARTYGLMSYRLGGLSDTESTKLENFLAEVFAGDPPGVTGHARAIGRSQQRDRAIEQLRRQRIIDRSRRDGAARFEELLDDDDAVEDSTRPAAQD